MNEMGDNAGSSTGTTLHLPASMKFMGEENWPLFKVIKKKSPQRVVVCSISNYADLFFILTRTQLPVKSAFATAIQFTVNLCTILELICNMKYSQMATLFLYIEEVFMVPNDLLANIDRLAIFDCCYVGASIRRRCPR